MRGRRISLRLFSLFQVKHPAVAVGYHTDVLARRTLHGAGLIKLDIRCAAVVEI